MFGSSRLKKTRTIKIIFEKALWTQNVSSLYSAGDSLSTKKKKGTLFLDYNHTEVLEIVTFGGRFSLYVFQTLALVSLWSCSLGRYGC